MPTLGLKGQHPEYMQHLRSKVTKYILPQTPVAMARKANIKDAGTHTWQEEPAEQTSASPTPDFLLSANKADGYSKTAAIADFQKKRGLSTSISSGELGSLGSSISVLFFIFVHDPVCIFNGSFNNLLDSLRIVFI